MTTSETCARKVRYDSSKEAKRKLRKLRSKFNKKYSAYRCPVCGGYHLTTHVSMGYKVKVRGNQEVIK